MSAFHFFRFLAVKPHARQMIFATDTVIMNFNVDKHNAILKNVLCPGKRHIWESAEFSMFHFQQISESPGTNENASNWPCIHTLNRNE